MVVFGMIFASFLEWFRKGQMTVPSRVQDSACSSSAERPAEDLGALQDVA